MHSHHTRAAPDSTLQAGRRPTPEAVPLTGPGISKLILDFRAHSHLKFIRHELFRELFSPRNCKQVSQSALCRAVQDGFLLPELPNFMQYYTRRYVHVVCTLSVCGCHPHMHVIHTRMLSAPAHHPHTHMSSAHHLQHSSWSAWT